MLHPFLALAAATIVPAGSSPIPVPPTIQERALSEEVEQQLILFDFVRQDRMTLPIDFDGYGQLDFMVDTGAERSAISSEAAETLGLEPSDTRTVVSFAGVTKVPLVVAPSVSFAKDATDRMELLTFGRRAIGADGVIGIDSLKDKTVTFDFDAREMRMRPSATRAIRAGKGEVSVKLEEHKGRMVISNATVARRPVDVVIDTGSAISVGNMALHDALERDRKLTKIVDGMMLTYTGELVPVEMGIVHNIDVDGFTITRMPVAFVRSPSFDYLGYADKPVLFMGMEALRAFSQLEIDFARKTAVFKVRGLPSDHFKSYWFVEQEQRRARNDYTARPPARPTGE